MQPLVRFSERLLNRFIKWWHLVCAIRHESLQALRTPYFRMRNDAQQWDNVCGVAAGYQDNACTPMADDFLKQVSNAGIGKSPVTFRPEGRQSAIVVQQQGRTLRAMQPLKKFLPS